MDTHLQPPRCFICEQKHWASEECPDSGAVSGPPEGAIQVGEVSRDGSVRCPICHGDEALVEDAEKWRKERERRKRYMRKRRKG
jgi:hypothetical protein